MKWLKQFFKDSTDYKGRTRRRDFWCFWAFYHSINYIFSEIPYKGTPILIVWSIVIAILFPYFLAACVRRLHDVGKSGWWYLIVVIPALAAIICSLISVSKFIIITSLAVFILGYIWLLILTLKDSQPGTNKWGDNPKEVETNKNLKQN
ncbi:MAG: DUF805 domain-containing protein [Bacteroidales bacterium]|nr:DUF805 domain-containing protein [Bacteroidales bacterium]